jgi:signal transduction histidine kinase
MAVPLAYEASETEWIGVVILDSRAQARTFAPRDLAMLEAIAGQASLAIKNALLVRKVESVVSEEWRRLDGVVRDLPLGVVVLDEHRVCTMANRWVTRHPEAGTIAVGAPVESIAGIACDRLVGSDLHTSTTIGERAYTVAAITSGRETVVVLTDITDERERQTREAHKDRVAMIGQLAGGIAHDFNNLLQVILACASCLEESLHGTPDAEDADQIMHAATSASELTRQLLTFSRRELVTAKVLDVASVVKSLERLLRRTLGSSVELVVKVGPRLPRILMDTAQLEQILMNLVVNARDAIAGTGTVTLSVDQSGTSGVLIEVSDTGAGMRPEVAARVFEPYFTTKALGKGTGLGLATVHGIVQQARGEITVTSMVGTGTTFRIVLPATDQAPESKRSSLIPVETGSTILVVDDDDAVRNVTERFLRNAGYSVLSASSGAAALALSRSHAGMIDLLLTDVVMPGQSGRDLAEALQLERSATRVVFMSGYHHQSPIGNSQFIAKPFGRDALLEKVKGSLARDADRV